MCVRLAIDKNESYDLKTELSDIKIEMQQLLAECKRLKKYLEQNQHLIPPEKSVK